MSNPPTMLEETVHLALREMIATAVENRNRDSCGHVPDAPRVYVCAPHEGRWSLRCPGCTLTHEESHWSLHSLGAFCLVCDEPPLPGGVPLRQHLQVPDDDPPLAPDVPRLILIRHLWLCAPCRRNADQADDR